MSRTTAMSSVAVLFLVACAMPATAALVHGVHADAVQRAPVAEELMHAARQGRIPPQPVDRQSTAPRRTGPETSASSSLYFDSQKKRWIYSYTSTAEFKQASGPNGYASYNPEKTQPKGQNTKAASSIAYDPKKRVYVVTFTYSTELEKAP
jgi:hypothetical protein